MKGLLTILSVEVWVRSKTSSKNGFLAVLLFMAVPFAASAQQNEYVDSLWNRASQAYTEGRWQDAVSDYEQIGLFGLESAPLYANTGSAYYKSGNIAKAILYYERALKLDPSYEDAMYNLDFLREQIKDKIDSVPDFIMTVWAHKISRLMDSDAWAVMFLVFLAVTCGMILLFLLAPTPAGRRSGFYIGLVTLLFAVASLSFSLWQKNDYEQADSAVVMVPVASVKSSPSSEASQTLFVLHEGTKVDILDSVGAWTNIEISDGRQGWIRSNDIEVI